MPKKKSEQQAQEQELKKVKIADEASVDITVDVAEVSRDKDSASFWARFSRVLVTLIAIGGVATGFIFIINELGFEIFGGQEAAQTAADRLADFGIWIFFIFFAMYLTQAIFLNFIPGTITFFMIFGFFLFGQNIGILIAVGVVCVIASSLTVYTIGRFGGRRLLFWLFGKRNVEAKLDWFKRRGLFYVPALYIVPLMTGDLICLVCGASKVKFWHFLIIILICRPLEIALVAAYVPILRFIQSNTTPFEMFTLVNLVILNVVFFIAHYKKIVSGARKLIGREEPVSQIQQETPIVHPPMKE